MAILEAYVRQLIEDKQNSLIATYTATLPQHLQLEWYAKFLEGRPDFVVLSKFTGNSFDVACIQCEHSHLQEKVPFAFARRVASPRAQCGLGLDVSVITVDGAMKSGFVLVFLFSLEANYHVFCLFNNSHYLTLS